MPGEVIYYMRIGNRVKIGWSTNLPGRLATINPEELMAVEPGGRAVECHRHAEFSYLRTHGEWFRLASPLVEHIASLRTAAKTEPLPESQPGSAPRITADDAEQLLSTADASSHAGVTVAAIRKWVQRGHLKVAARDPRGRPMFRWIDVAKAEHATRAHANRKYLHRSYAA